MHKTPVWKNKMPEFLGAIAGAESERHIQMACEDIKASVVASYPNTPNSRRVPMTEIRKAIRGRFPCQETESQDAPFPYFFTDFGKGNIKRWEHLAIKHLSEEWNSKSEVTPEVVKPEEVEPEVGQDILGQVGLTTDEIESVKQAAQGVDMTDWVKQAILQRANAINRKNAVLGEDLSEVPSEVLMNEKKYRSSPKASRELVSRAVMVVKQWNYDCPEQKWCITNKVLSELSGVTVKAVAKAVEGMDLESYNAAHGLEPLGNRSLKAAVGNPGEVMSLANVTGVE